MVERNIYLEDIPLQEAQLRLQAALKAAGHRQALSGEQVPLQDAHGRITAEAIPAQLSSPHYHCAAMDGYAVKDTNTIGATETQPKSLIMGATAFPINTGDPLPENTNAVIMIEHVNLHAENSLEIYASVAPWQHVRLVGEDIIATEIVLQINHKIRPVDLGALAACGHDKVLVRRKPRVTLIPTGTELVSAGTQPQSGQLIEYNSLMLSGQISEAGGVPYTTEIIADDYQQLSKIIRQAIEASPDLVLILSGSSAGSRDFTAQIIREMGELLVHGVAVRPGHPVIIGMVDQTPVIGIPGYPVSAALTGEIFVVPLIQQWLSLTPPKAPTIEAVTTQKIASPIGDDDFVRVALAQMDDQILATPLQRGAGVITSLVEADGLAHLPRFQEGVDKGGTLQVSLYRSLETIQNTVMMIGSHDPMLDLLATYLRIRAPEQRIVSVSVGSIGGLVALKRGDAHLAGIHLFDPETKTYNMPHIKKFLKDKPVRLVTFAHRSQGLMVPKGNPQGIKTISDVASLRYINRQRGAGTRILFDHLLEQAQIESDSIAGYDHEEYTHLAVAAAVADGIGDCGMGVYSAAQSMNLDFIPLTQERFDLVIPHHHLENAGIQAILSLLEDEAFKTELGKQAGYDSTETGRVWLD